MAFDPNRWTMKTQEAVAGALESARSRNNPEVTPDHLLAAMLGQEGTAALPTLQRVGVNIVSLRNRLGDSLGRLPTHMAAASLRPRVTCGTPSSAQTRRGADSATSTCPWSISSLRWRSASRSAGTIS
jgi:ATP-dependent Clp protease ATP-binding subunit ClpA